MPFLSASLQREYLLQLKTYTYSIDTDLILSMFVHQVFLSENKILFEEFLNFSKSILFSIFLYFRLVLHLTVFILLLLIFWIVFSYFCYISQIPFQLCGQLIDVNESSISFLFTYILVCIMLRVWILSIFMRSG